MADVSQIKLPNGTSYTLKDEGALQLTGGNVTGPVSFGDSVSIDEATLGDLVINGNVSFVNARTVANNLVDNLELYTSTPIDGDTYIASYADGKNVAHNGVNTYGRRPIAKLWEYIDNKINTAGYTKNTGTVTSITLTQGTGISIGSSGTAITTSGSRTISLATITKSDTTSTASPAHGGTFTAIDSITYDTYGRVTGVNTKTVTLPASGNTDAKVTQSATTTTSWRKVMLHYTTNDSGGDVPASVTNQVYAAKGVEVQSSTGTLYADILSSKKISSLITGGSQTAAVTTSPYKPALWKFNAGITPANGDVVVITAPGGGHSYGEFLSLDNGTTYKPITHSGTGKMTTHYASGSPIALVYDSDWTATSMYPLAGGTSTGTIEGGAWRVINGYLDGNTYTQCYCSTAAATAAKVGTMSSYVATANRYVMINIVYANTADSALTMNINGTGAKAIYINGSASSTSNYTLPAGSYLVFYDGTNYHFRTDGYRVSKHYNEAPTSEVTRYPLTTSVTGVGFSDIINTNTRYWIKNGTTSAVGYNYLALGNATASGTANNSQGYLRLYGPNTGYSNLTYANSTSNVTNTLPATTGTLINTAGGQQINGITTFYREGTTANNYAAGLKFSVKDTTTNQTYSSAYIYAYQDHASTTAGTNMVIHSGGGMFLGSGEAPANHYSAKGASYTGEDTFITADGTMYIQSTGNTIANRVGFYIDTSHQIIPCKADTATNNIGSIGTSSYKWANLYVTNINGVAVGTSPKFTDNNTTYTLSGALSTHKFTSTLTAGGSGSGTSTSDFTLAAGTGITITDDTSARKMTIACSIKNIDTGSVSKNNVSIGGGSIQTITQSATSSDWTLAGIIGFNISNASSGGKNYDKCVPLGVYKSGNNAVAKVKNNGSADAIIQVTFYVLYMK